MSNSLSDNVASSASSASSSSLSTGASTIVTTIQAIQGMKKLFDERPELVVEITTKVNQLKNDIKNPINLLIDIMELVEQIGKTASLGGDIKKEICKVIFGNIISDPSTVTLFSGIIDVLIDTIVEATKGGLNINVAKTFCEGCCEIFSSFSDK